MRRLTRNVYVPSSHGRRRARASRTLAVVQGPTGAEGVATTEGLHDATGALNGNHTSGTTTIAIDAGSELLFGSGLQIIAIEDEQILATAFTGTSFTGCTRGFKGTTAAAHLDGAAVHYP